MDLDAAAGAVQAAKLGWAGCAAATWELAQENCGGIMLPERGTPGEALRECDEHEHRSIPEAFACSVREIGRNPTGPGAYEDPQR